MDKYQEELIKNIRIECRNVVTNQPQDCFKDRKIIEVVQSEDITQVRYELVIYGGIINNIEVFNDKTYEDAKHHQRLVNGKMLDSTYFVLLDFDKKDISKIKISFKNNIAEPIELKINYIEADKELYYKKKEAKENAQNHDILLNNLKISYSTDKNLVNIRFQNATDDVAFTKILLYCTNITVSNIVTDTERNTQQITEQSVATQYMGCFNVEEGMFYKAISNLTKGEYAFKVAQYDKNGNVIVESNLMPFCIISESAFVGRYSGKNQVVH